MKLYVGNLPYDTTEAQLSDMFAAHGTPSSAKVIMDRDTGRSKGFGFVEFENDSEAKAATEALNGTDLSGRSLTVSEARPRPESGYARGASR